MFLEFIKVHLVTGHNFFDQEKYEKCFSDGTGRTLKEKSPTAIRRLGGGKQGRLTV
jgi:hypothetical protein